MLPLIDVRLSDPVKSADGVTFTSVVEPGGTLKSILLTPCSWSVVTVKTFTLPVA